MDTSCLQVCCVLHACCVFASFVCVSVALAFVLLPLQVEQPGIQNSNELNVHFGYVLRVQ